MARLYSFIAKLTGIRFALLSTLLPALCAGATAAEDSAIGPFEISWYLFDYPPAYITDGPFKGQGYQDQILSEIEQSVPSVRIQRITTSMARVMANMKHGKASCAGALAKTPERMAHMVFSNPALVSLPIRLVVRVDKIEALTPKLKDGKVQLLALLEGNILAGAIVQGRTYGSVVDEVMAVGATMDSVVSVGEADLVYRMLSRGRISYTFGYPDEVGFQARMLEREGLEAKFVTLPIAGLGNFAQSYIGCTKDAAGVAFIASVNRILAGNRAKAPWQSFYMDWIDASARADITATLANDTQ